MDRDSMLNGPFVMTGLTRHQDLSLDETSLKLVGEEVENDSFGAESVRGNM